MENTAFKELTHEIQERLFLAEFNAEYHDLLERRYSLRDFWLRMCFALSGAGVWICIRFFHAGVWTDLSGAITLISTTILPILRWNKLIPRIEAEKLRWIGLKNEYRDLWQDAKMSGNWDDALKDLKRLRKKDAAVEKSVGLIPKHNDLLKEAREAVIALHRKSGQ
jgi:uncharacterized protein (UPF0335 family)